MNITLGFSPCPNDTFIFDALVNRKIDTQGLNFLPVLEDIQTLNVWAPDRKLDVTKLSFPAFFKNRHSYAMLQSGSALGKGVGPLLIAKKMVAVPDVAHCHIAIPGEMTTANFLLSYAFPAAKNKEAFLFSEIEEAVVTGKTDLGVIIHENRFTYQQKGLIKICDLGEIWEEREQVPIPLACIAASTALPSEVQQQVNALIRKSIEYAFDHYPQITDYTRDHAQAMDEEVMRKHIELYVNNYSIDLGAEGNKAIDTFYRIYSSISQSAALSS